MSYAYRNRKKNASHQQRKELCIEQGLSPRLADKRDRLIQQEVQRLNRNRNRRGGNSRFLSRAMSKVGLA